MISFSNLINSTKEKLKNNKKLKYIIIAVLALIILGIVFINYNKTNTSTTSSNTSTDYVSQLESKLKETISLIDGVGNLSIVINFADEGETVLAMKTTTTETSSGKETIETPILVNGKTVVLKELNPKIIGVMIVCEGGSNINVVNKILNATSTLLNIETNKINILKMK